MKLAYAVENWDGKSSSAIRDVYLRYHEDSAFISDIIELSRLLPLQRGTTWLLKYHCEQEHSIERAEVIDLCALLGELVHWEARLHVLQCLPYFTFPSEVTAAIEAFLDAGLNDKNKFVRAWSYNGYYELAKQYPKYVAKAEQLFDKALQDEAASVKARIRNIKKKGSLSTP